jgi:hypothetical protein
MNRTKQIRLHIYTNWFADHIHLKFLEVKGMHITATTGLQFNLLCSMCVCVCVCVYPSKRSIWLLCKDNNPHTMGSDLIKTSYIASVILRYLLLYVVYKHSHIMSNTTVIFFCEYERTGS